MLSENNGGSTKRYAWVILATVYLASFAATQMLNKVPPLVGNLTEEFSVSLSQVGLLMSMLGLTGLILAIPAGIILQRLGLRITGTVALGFVSLGAALGAMSSSFNFLILSRILEGIGLALIVVLSPAAIAMWFPPEKVGTPMGIWTTSGPVSGFLIMTLAPILALTIGWTGVWWITAAVSIIALVVFWLFIRQPPTSADAGRSDSDGSLANAPPSWKKALRSRYIWFLGLAILIFNLLITPVLTYYVTFLSSVHALPVTRAGFIFGLTALATVPAAPLTGWISDAVGTRKWVAIIGFLVFAPLYILAFQVSGFWIIVVAILMGFFLITIPISILSAVPEVMIDSRLAGIGMAVIVLCQNLGLVIGPPLFGRLVDSTSWVTAAYAFAPLCLLGALVIFLNKKIP